MAQRTPLYDWHVAHGGKMVDFAGWDMPISYTATIEEHNAVRNSVGLFDISHMGRLHFAGADSLPLIQQVWTNNAATMKDGQVRYGLVCNPQGGIKDDILVYRWRDSWAMVVNASNREKIVGWLAEHQSGKKVEIDDRTKATCMIAVQGPKAMELCRGLTPADADKLAYYFATPTTYHGEPAVISRTGYTGEDGIEIIVGSAQAVELWEQLIALKAVPCGLGARDTLRLEAAMPLYGHELGEDIDPLQAGLAWAVKLDKGEFIGKEALLRRRDDNTLRQRVGLQLRGKRMAREGMPVQVESKEIGRITSGTFTPTVGKAIAMAFVDPAYMTAGTQCSVNVREKLEQAEVVPLPFYRRKKS